MYDVAISYHNEKYKEAKKIYHFLESEGWNVFFAPEKQQEMISEKLDVKLYNLYKNQSYLKLLLVSQQYSISEWTQLEKRMALESTKEDNKRLVIVNYTKENLSEELSEFIYINGMNKTEDQIAVFVSERLKNLNRQSNLKPNTQYKNQVASSYVNKGINFGDNTKIVGDINFGK